MKRVLKFLPLLMVSLFFSCSKEEIKFIDLSETVAKDPRFSKFNQLLVSNGLTDVLKSETLTVLAPTNEALANVDLANFSKADVLNLLRTHLITTDVETQPFLAGGVKTLGSDVYLSRTWGGDLFINGTTKVIKPALAANNGSIYAVLQIVVPPLENVLNLTKKDSNLSEFYSLVSAADPSVSEALSAASKQGITIFAPVNTAFEAYYKTMPKSVLTDASNKKTLTNLLTNHVVSNRVFTTDFATNIGAFSTINTTGKITFGFSNDGYQVMGNNGKAKLIKSDFLSTNAVLHTVDKVLAP